MQQGTCDANNCDRNRVARGLCMMHYQRTRAGKPLDIPTTLRCDSCGECFSPKSSVQVYCSPACRDRMKSRRAKGYRNVLPNTKSCLLCERTFTREGRAVKYCSSACRRQMATLRLYKRTAGLTETRYREMIQEQAGLCAVCGFPPAVRDVLFVDHCHAQNRVRGLICHNCNVGLGNFKDDPARLAAAIDYLARTA